MNRNNTTLALLALLVALFVAASIAGDPAYIRDSAADCRRTGGTFSYETKECAP